VESGIPPCLTEAIDTNTPAGRDDADGRGIAEFERAMLRERTKAGLDSARREGHIGGRRPQACQIGSTDVCQLILEMTVSFSGVAPAYAPQSTRPALDEASSARSPGPVTPSSSSAAWPSSA
jgi:hypothetical protein